MNDYGNRATATTSPDSGIYSLQENPWTALFYPQYPHQNNHQQQIPNSRNPATNLQPSFIPGNGNNVFLGGNSLRNRNCDKNSSIAQNGSMSGTTTTLGERLPYSIFGNNEGNSRAVKSGLGRVTSLESDLGIIDEDTFFHISTVVKGTELPKTGDTVMVTAEAVVRTPYFKWNAKKVQLFKIGLNQDTHQRKFDRDRDETNTQLIVRNIDWELIQSDTDTPASSFNDKTKAFAKANEESDISHEATFNETLRTRADPSETQIVAKSKKSKNIGTVQYVEAEGENAEPQGENSEAEGENSEAEGENSESEGENSDAEGENSKAEGENSEAEVENSEAEGENSDAEGENSEAKGKNSNTEGENSEAEGKNSDAEGENSDAEGENSESEGENSDAESENSEAEGENSKAEGENSEAKDENSKAEGENSEAEDINHEKCDLPYKTLSQILRVLVSSENPSDTKRNLLADSSPNAPVNHALQDIQIKTEEVGSILANNSVTAGKTTNLSQRMSNFQALLADNTEIKQEPPEETPQPPNLDKYSIALSTSLPNNRSIISPLKICKTKEEPHEDEWKKFSDSVRTSSKKRVSDHRTCEGGERLTKKSKLQKPGDSAAEDSSSKTKEQRTLLRLPVYTNKPRNQYTNQSEEFFAGHGSNYPNTGKSRRFDSYEEFAATNEFRPSNPRVDFSFNDTDQTFNQTREPLDPRQHFIPPLRKDGRLRAEIGICQVCGKTEHRESVCRHRSGGKEFHRQGPSTMRLGDAPICQICGKNGHRASVCWHSPRDARFDFGEEPSPPGCLFCGIKGHDISVCRKRLKDDTCGICRNIGHHQYKCRHRHGKVKFDFGAEPRGGGPPTGCLFCGNRGHDVSVCRKRLRDDKCMSCNRIGHHENVCRFRSKPK